MIETCSHLVLNFVSLDPSVIGLPYPRAARYTFFAVNRIRAKYFSEVCTRMTTELARAFARQGHFRWGSELTILKEAICRHRWDPSFSSPRVSSLSRSLSSFRSFESYGPMRLALVARLRCILRRSWDGTATRNLAPSEIHRMSKGACFFPTPALVSLPLLHLFGINTRFKYLTPGPCVRWHNCRNSHGFMHAAVRLAQGQIPSLYGATTREV